MPTLNEVKEQMVTVKSVGEFTNAIQQIATIRMVKLRERVLRSRPFLEAANAMLTELVAFKNAMSSEDLMKLEKNHDKQVAGKSIRRAVIVITSNQGLTGHYNFEIYAQLEKMIKEEKDSDFYVIGKKGQEYFANGKFPFKYFPYEVPDNFEIHDLQRLVNLFDFYGQITLVYSRYINTVKREVIAISVITPIPPEHISAGGGKFIFEPDLLEMIDGVSKKLRAALFQQQIFDGRLSQYSAQMMGMKAATDNANDLLGELRLEYNKQRRKMIDKKISEVFAGMGAW